MTGTLTITSPSTDSASGFSTTSIPIAWSFTGSPGSTTQTQRRVTLQQTGSVTLIVDTTMQASTATTYTFTGLASGVSYDAWVYVTDTAGTVTSTKRVIISNFQRSLPPVLNFGPDDTESLVIYITNPVDGSGRPAATSNLLYRKILGSSNGWTYAATVAANGYYVDRFLRPDTQYLYFARTDSGADCAAYTVTTPSTTGVWFYDPNNVSSTLRHFPYGDAGVEVIDEEEAFLQLVGRTYPVVEVGVEETQTVAITSVIPFSDADWRDQIEWWRSRKRAKATLLIRDGRGHTFAGYIAGQLTITPTRSGATIGASFQRVDYVSYTTGIPESAFNQGANNDGGNGVYGNGSNGNGY